MTVTRVDTLNRGDGIPATGTSIDLRRYPIHELDSARGQALVSECRERMRRDGVCLLRGFLNAEALATMKAEASSALQNAFFCHNTHNAYLRDDDPAFPEDHPRRRLLQTDVGSIANDDLPADGTLCRLYAYEPLTRFIGKVLGHEEFHRSADPIGALSINVFEPGGGHSWHFDESHFTVTIMLQPAESGGHFEYVPSIRTAESDNYEEVEQILDGKHPGVERLPFEAGTLCIFAGRNTLHRVTTVGGRKHRLVPVLCYDTVPGSINSDEVRMLFWGRCETREALR